MLTSDINGVERRFFLWRKNLQRKKPPDIFSNLRRSSGKKFLILLFRVVCSLLENFTIFSGKCNDF